MTDELYFFRPPFDLPDMEKAVERIEQAKQNKERIAVCGDYDADGVTASAILYTYLKDNGYDVVCSIRNASKAATDCITIPSTSCTKAELLIVTVDNGISAAEEIDYAKSLGIDTVVTDHHLPGRKAAEGRGDCRRPFARFIL